MPIDFTINRPLTRDDLHGCRAAEYERWSSIPQGKRSTQERQGEARRRIINHLGLVVEPRWSFQDPGLSASKGHHRTKGRFGELLALAEAGEFRDARPVVLVVEATDRLFREGLLTGAGPLKTLIDGNLVIATGDGSIWCRHSLDGDGNHKLLAEMNAGKRYAARLREWAEGAHRKRRTRLAAVVEDPGAERPMLNGRTPFWLKRLQPAYKDGPPPPEGNGYWYVLDEDGYAPVVRRVYGEAGAGRTVKQIAAGLNADGIPSPNGKVWRASRVGTILRDRHILGYYTPQVRDGDKRLPATREVAGVQVAIGEVKVAPAAITEKEWYAARDVLEGRKCRLRGRKGTTVPNLFSGRAFCPTCNGRLRADTGGGIRNGRRKNHLLCAAYVESKTCSDKTRYDMHHFERLLLPEIVILSRLAPRTPTEDASKLAAARAAALANVDRLEKTKEGFRPHLPEPWAIAEIAKAGREQDAARKRADELASRIDMAASADTRRADNLRFLKGAVGPAVKGEVDAREQLRTLLARIDYRIVGGTCGEAGGLVLTVGEHERVVMPPGAFDASHPDNQPDETMVAA